MITGEQGAGKLASPVREETDGKGPGQGHLAGGPLHSEGGCAEKAGFTNGEPGPRRAAHPVHERAETAQIYIHADQTIKQRALDRTTPPGIRPGRYHPPDALLAFLEQLT
jgi:hypothetical protein